MAKPQASIDPQSWALLLFLSVLWGGSYLFIGVAVKELPPLLRSSWRGWWFASSILVPLHLLLQGALPRDPRVWRNFAMSLLEQHRAIHPVHHRPAVCSSSGLGSVIDPRPTPLFAVALLTGFGYELVGPKIAGLLLGLAGVVVIKGAGLLETGTQSLGILLCLAAAFSYGAAALWARRYLQAYCAAVAGHLPAAVLVGADDPDCPGIHLSCRDVAGLGHPWLGLLLALAILSTALAYIVFFRILVRAGASAVTLVTMLLPVVAIFLGHVILNEVLLTREITGALIMAQHVGDRRTPVRDPRARPERRRLAARARRWCPGKVSGNP